MANLLRTAYIRRAMMMNPTLFKYTAIRALSAAPAPKPNPHGWKSWKDIPDSELPACPDPTNPLYELQQYKNIQKKRIWYQMNEHIPIYFREGTKDKVLVSLYVVMLFSLLSYEYYMIVTKVAV
ncbi:hypothetical protein DERF_010805 [Dermatophagoides farinae]|uniref:Uncharacterized protein n=1 Tax=Dermatophagoides farinae TaxID=6954 RepID=A0A922HR08_DERFA|nr:uncharacterized protein LOC124498132 [Dermatophagoides farinae]KAH7642897.1 hypothetical protein HUG17_9588 [Dermatophagoides farinae]KAH9506058.1 hypothetical protein DERF_010805 [Dermatophagoides farinae]